MRPVIAERGQPRGTGLGTFRRFTEWTEARAWSKPRRLVPVRDR
ncbi:hypothetical protein ACH4F6_30845 [Streptomyces sp. NPDC017936]